MPGFEQIDAATASARRKAGVNFVLLDVREPFELDLARVSGAQHIPMKEIPERFGELDPERETIVMCHHGSRSSKVAAFLVERGFDKVLNLRGGIEAWALEADPSVGRY